MWWKDATLINLTYTTTCFTPKLSTLHGIHMHSLCACWRPSLLPGQPRVVLSCVIPGQIQHLLNWSLENARFVFAEVPSTWFQEHIPKKRSWMISLMIICWQDLRAVFAQNMSGNIDTVSPNVSKKHVDYCLCSYFCWCVASETCGLGMLIKRLVAPKGWISSRFILNLILTLTYWAQGPSNTSLNFTKYVYIPKHFQGWPLAESGKISWIWRTKWTYSILQPYSCNLGLQLLQLLQSSVPTQNTMVIHHLTVVLRRSRFMISI